MEESQVIVTLFGSLLGASLLSIIESSDVVETDHKIKKFLFVFCFSFICSIMFWTLFPQIINSSLFSQPTPTLEFIAKPIGSIVPLHLLPKMVFVAKAIDTIMSLVFMCIISLAMIAMTLRTLLEFGYSVKRI